MSEFIVRSLPRSLSYTYGVSTESHNISSVQTCKGRNAGSNPASGPYFSDIMHSQYFISFFLRSKKLGWTPVPFLFFLFVKFDFLFSSFFLLFQIVYFSVRSFCAFPLNIPLLYYIFIRSSSIFLFRANIFLFACY